MRTLRIRAVLAFTLIIASGPALAQNAPQLINIPLSRPGEPISLDIDIVSARIEVVGESREDAEFEVSVTDGKRTIITPSGTQTITGGGYALEVDEHDNEISLDTDWRANKIAVVARVPRGADLYLSTVNDGEIIVSNISGNLELSNINGPITATEISGSVIAESVNDTIDVTFVSIDDVNASSLESMNGDLLLRLPANVSVQLHLDNADGEIFSDFEVDVQASKPTIERNDDRGGVEVRIESIIIASINGGGPVIRLKTLRGDIHILKSK